VDKGTPQEGFDDVLIETFIYPVCKCRDSIAMNVWPSPIAWWAAWVGRAPRTRTGTNDNSVAARENEVGAVG